MSLKDFPFSYETSNPVTTKLPKRIGIAGTEDDLSRFMPIHDNLLSPLKLDEHSALLLSEYERHKLFLNSELGCYVGRSRVAALTQDMDGRQKCSYLGRCLWGCPSEAFYTPSLTLNQCKNFPNFRYLTGAVCEPFQAQFKPSNSARCCQLPCTRTPGRIFPVDKLVSSREDRYRLRRIFLQSIFEGTREIVKLQGLMDNRQVLMPFVNLKMIGKRYDPETYQYHQIAMGITGDEPQGYIHALITTLKTALIHPIIQNIPLDLPTATYLFRNLHAALGLVNVNFHDTRREDELCNPGTQAGCFGSGFTGQLFTRQQRAGSAEEGRERN